VEVALPGRSAREGDVDLLAFERLGFEPGREPGGQLFFRP
jgi:hypothetical protein